MNYKSHLSNNFYSMLALAKATMTRNQLKETLLATDGWVMACGRIWDIRSKHLGAGVYSVYLKLRYN